MEGRLRGSLSHGLAPVEKEGPVLVLAKPQDSRL